MSPKTRVAAWTAVLVAISFGGSSACAALARLAHARAGMTGAHSLVAGIRLPVGVVNAALGAFPVTLGALAVFASLGFAGWRLACAMRAAATIPERTILLIQALVGLSLSFFAVTFSSDPYAYVLFARAHGVFGLNPYIFFGQMGAIRDSILQQCLAFFGDPPPSDNYGPLWTIAVGLAGRMEAASSLWVQFWTQRVAAVAGAVACTAGVLRLLGKATPDARRFGASLFAFHPLVLWESGIGGHNDFLMLALAVWAFAVVDAYPLLACALLGVAIGIKFVPVLLLPLLIARVVRKAGAASALLGAVVALAIPVVAFTPFWTGHATILSLESLDASLGVSPTWLLVSPFAASGVANLPVAGSLHGTLVGALTWGRLLQIVLDLVVFAIIVAATVRVARGSSLREVWRVIAAFVWTLPSVNSWYVSWLTPAAAFGGTWAAYAWWFGALAGLHLAIDSGAVGSLPGAVGWAALITVVFMGLPIALAYRARRPGTGEL
ncbi:MAG TPA: glycosyltransferase 87 family protein [Candidatus Eremiobacteraceae bacterium]|nr:glycosyltransferase 87 family protein [Candidatus Eremiobacteraceae bacterium]